MDRWIAAWMIDDKYLDIEKRTTNIITRATKFRKENINVLTIRFYIEE